MVGRIAFLISMGGLTAFVITALSNLIMAGFYGLSESKYRLMFSLAIGAVFFGIYLVLTSPGS